MLWYREEKWIIHIGAILIDRRTSTGFEHVTDYYQKGDIKISTLIWKCQQIQSLHYISNLDYWWGTIPCEIWIEIILSPMNPATSSGYQRTFLIYKCLLWKVISSDLVLSFFVQFRKLWPAYVCFFGPPTFFFSN